MKKSDEWYTPQWLVDWAHELLGGPPDFDPASSEQANLRVRARGYDFLGEFSEVRRRWEKWPPGDSYRIEDPKILRIPSTAKTVFMNPPFSQAKQFWFRLWDWHCKEGPDSRFFAIMPANVNSSYLHHMVRNAHVWIPEKRVAFVDPRTGEEAKAPRGNVCVVTNEYAWRGPRPGIWISETE